MENLVSDSIMPARYLKMALRAAMRSDVRCKHGAVLVRGGSVLSVGWNRMKNDPRNEALPETSYSVHAEIDALRKAKNFKGATMFIVRSNGGCSDPCVNCRMALERAGIRWVA